MTSLAKKLSEVGKDIGWGIPKDGRNDAQRYDFTSASAVKIRVGPPLAARGIAVCSGVEVIQVDDVTSAKGTQFQRVLARVTLTFVDGDTGETLSSQGIGSGMDSGDKAAMKAQTAAEKYAYVSAFTLAMGEDPERDEKPAHDPLDELEQVKTRDALDAWARENWDALKADQKRGPKAWPRVQAVAKRCGIANPGEWSKARAYAAQEDEAAE
jgi:hypothetical protein